jgi:hypothetical protein
MRFSIVAMLVLYCGLLVRQRAVAASANSSPDAAKLVNLDAGASVDLPNGGGSDDIGAVMLAITKKLDGVAMGQWRVMGDKKRAATQLAWLAKDFRTTAFAKASGVDEAVLMTTAKVGPLHIGLLSVHFPSCKLLRAARARVEKASRFNFLLPVLTIFRIRELDHSLLFVFSETPLHRGVERILSDVGAVVGPDKPCVEGLKSSTSEARQRAVH